MIGKNGGIIFNGGNINAIASYLDTPELQLFKVIDRKLYIDYWFGLKKYILILEIGDEIYLNDDNDIEISSKYKGVR